MTRVPLINLIKIDSKAEHKSAVMKVDLDGNKALDMKSQLQSAKRRVQAYIR